MAKLFDPREGASMVIDFEAARQRLRPTEAEKYVNDVDRIAMDILKKFNLLFVIAGEPHPFEDETDDADVSGC
jgi:hypothetical protein